MPRVPSNKEIIDRHDWLGTLSLPTLRQLAKDRGIAKWNELTQSQLIAVLTGLGLSSNPLSTSRKDVKVQ